MKTQLKLFMLMIGCKPQGRHTEQHDVFFGIGRTPKDLIPQLMEFWPEAADKMHIDAWRQVNWVDGFEITVIDKQTATTPPANTLFFINLGGYTQNIFDEQHYIVLSVKPDRATAIAQAKDTLFFEQTNFPGAPSTLMINMVLMLTIFTLSRISSHHPKSKNTDYKLM
jgi:hypothetical protein